MWYRRPSSLTIGLDIGRSAVRALAMDHAGGIPEIVGCHEERWEPTADSGDPVKGTPKSLHDALVRTVDQLRHMMPVHRAHITTAIYGRGVVIKPLEVEPVAPHHVRELLRWEADEHLPFPAEDTVFDHVMLPKDHAGEMRVLLVAVHRPLVANRLALLQAAGIKQSAMTVDALATLNACKWHDPDCAIGCGALITVSAMHVQTVLLTDGVPATVWESDGISAGLSEGALSDAITAAVQRCKALELDRHAVAHPVPLRGAWIAYEGSPALPLVNALGERLACPVHSMSAFSSLPIRPKAPGITGADGEGGKFVVACGLALQGAPLTITGGGHDAAH